MSAPKVFQPPAHLEANPRPPVRYRFTHLDRARAKLAWALAGLWMLDAALQLQPFMYTTAFPDTLRSAGQGSPGWVSAPAAWSAGLITHAQPLLNTLFALTQLAIAVGLLLPRWRKAALAVSVMWALLVWWLGEGLGMLLAGPMNVAMGIPGAVLLYALVAVLVWPSARGRDQSVATASPLRIAGARSAWLALWSLFVFETLRPANRSAQGWHDMVAGMSAGEPRWIGALNRTAAALLDHHGIEFSVALAAVCAVIAASVFAPPQFFRPALIVAIVLATAIWIVAQDFGNIATGKATDPNSGPLLVLMALCYWPISGCDRDADRSRRSLPD